MDFIGDLQLEGSTNGVMVDYEWRWKDNVRVFTEIAAIRVDLGEGGSTDLDNDPGNVVFAIDCSNPVEYPNGIPPSQFAVFLSAIEEEVKNGMWLGHHGGPEGNILRENGFGNAVIHDFLYGFRYVPHKRSERKN